MRKSGFEVLGMGFNNTDYPGSFTKPVRDVIESLLRGKVLHLYSGASLIGDERVDITHANATTNREIGEFISQDTRYWDWVLLDPPYAVKRVKKIEAYGLTGAISSDVILRRNVKRFLMEHTNNVLWLDTCAPMVSGFERVKLWLFLPGGFHVVRVLSWLRKANSYMFEVPQ